jgi:hypothetical protein
LGGRCYARNFLGGSTNSVEDRGQRERGFRGISHLVRGSTQFENEWNPYSDYVVMDVFSTELGIRLSSVKTSEFRGGLNPPKPPLGTPLFANIRLKHRLCSNRLKYICQASRVWRNNNTPCDTVTSFLEGVWQKSRVPGLMRLCYLTTLLV